ncbi:hypothetical protein RRG08_017578 [Elysia crispata]|uniref:Uncharacterized protein n=1 Tax=Elysia crispata TaxID=231223 RepID=A0AAE1CWQ8_9GAST|nr:hypothetical protein RRG08_017578 [Elysia crispata]
MTSPVHSCPNDNSSNVMQIGRLGDDHRSLKFKPLTHSEAPGARVNSQVNVTLTATGSVMILLCLVSDITRGKHRSASMGRAQGGTRWLLPGASCRSRGDDIVITSPDWSVSVKLCGKNTEQCSPATVGYSWSKAYWKN